MAKNKNDFNDFEDLSSYSSKSEYKKMKNSPKRKKKHIILKTIISFFSIVLILFGAAALYVSNYMLAGLTTTVITTDKEELGITSEAAEIAQENPGVTNIALFGLDSRSDNFSGRSDVVMILSIDEATNNIKLTSVLRDTRMDISDTDTAYYDKITHAYVYHGAEGTIRALNKSYNLNIEDYVTVNFYNMAEIVDAFGGVTVDVTSAEAYEINVNLNELSQTQYNVYDSGMLKLNGAQAVAYARIRNIGSDTERALRQQEIMSALLNSIPEIPAGDYPDLANQISYLCETSLDIGDILSFIPFASGGFGIETFSVPNYEGNDELVGKTDPNTGTWMWFTDLEEDAKVIHEFIYGESTIGDTEDTQTADDNEDTQSDE